MFQSFCLYELFYKNALKLAYFYILWFTVNRLTCNKKLELKSKNFVFVKIGQPINY